jgi:uncharacterized membrane protein YadS
VVADSVRPLPGLVALGAVGVFARAVGSVTPVDSLVVAVGSGVVLATLVDVPAWVQAGVDQYKLLLETGIVLLGASLTLDQLVASGPVVVGLAAAVVVFGVGFAELVGYAAGVESQTRSLLAAGASVCGVSAVLAVASSIDGDDATVTYAAGTVLLFDAVTLVAFPVAGAVLGLPDRVFGVWAGLSLFSTGPAAAAGFAVSDTAGQWATVTKLVRNSFIGVLAVGYALHHATGGEDRVDPTEVWTRFPKFLVGFLLVAVLANAGVVDGGAQDAVATAGDWLFTLAFVGVGAELNPGRLRATGLRPVGLVLAQFLTVTALAYLAVTILL